MILKKIYRRLFAAFGPQDWWPGDTPFEVMVGAILTQNTNWNNVEKAIDHLKRAGALTPKAVRDIPPGRLAELIRPSGFFNIKTRRLKNFVKFLFDEYGGSIKKMKAEPVEILREKILNVHGIGPETADSILLYALDKPVFVIDAYTKRVLSRHGLVEPDVDYHDVQGLFHSKLKVDIQHFNEYHALIVKVAKTFCKTRPECGKCPLNKPELYLEKRRQNSN